jgi:hypothetical protein
MQSEQLRFEMGAEEYEEMMESRRSRLGLTG